MHHLPLGTVTLLFTDIEGSTHLIQQVGERYADLLAVHSQLLRATFQHWNGHEVDTQGGSFFVAFARATDAVDAAVAAQRSLSSYHWPEGAAVRVRMGIHTGEPVLSGENYIGLDVHYAARIMSAGYGGQVLLSQTTRDLVERDLPKDASLRDLGEHRLKDIHYPSHLFQLVIAGLPADFPPLKTLDTSPNNLSLQPTPLIGRELEIATVQRLISREDVRLLTLTGPGGTGKTRLGLEVVARLRERFPAGIYFVNLAPLSDPALVVPAIAQTLALRETAERSLFDLVSTFLQEKQLLLLLDNFEHVASAAVRIAELLATCPKLKMIVTSRASLHIRGEQEFAVPTLSVPDPRHLPDLVTLSQYEAIALFMQCARTVRADFQLTNINAPSIAEMCVRLDGLPLAIELAAARIKVLPPQILLARLDQQLAVLTGGARDLPVRQQTLRNTIMWSYNLLGTAEQQLLRRLSVFAGGCSLEAAEALYATLDGKGNEEAGALLEQMTSLLDNSLLSHKNTGGKEPRFVMLETIRQYAWEALAESHELNAVLSALTAYYVSLLEAEPGAKEGGQKDRLELLEHEHANLRVALHFALEQTKAEHHSATAIRLGVALTPFWLKRGYWSEGRAFLEKALAVYEGIEEHLRARALVSASKLAFQQGDYVRAEMLAEESVQLFRGREDRREDRREDMRGSASALEIRGMVAWNRGHLSNAQAVLQEALALYRQTNDKEGMVVSLFALAWLARGRSEYNRAQNLCKESLALCIDLGDTRGVADARLLMAQMQFDTQAPPDAVRTQVEEALALYRQVEDKEGIAACFHLFGRITLQQGEMEKASSWFEQSAALHKELGHQAGLAWAVTSLARVALAQNDYATARSRYEESLTRARAIEDQELLVTCVEGLAMVMSAQGETVWAARYGGAAEALREAIGEPLAPVERVAYEMGMVATRRRLGEKGLMAAWAEGRSMTPEQILSAQSQSSSLQASQATAIPSHEPLVYPDDLTAREVDVLRLVAKGMTDVQVAEALVISPRTVNTHLTSIYSKIGVTSRSQATRYALEQGLV